MLWYPRSFTVGVEEGEAVVNIFYVKEESIFNKK